MPHGTSWGIPALLSLSSWVSALPSDACVIRSGICRGMGSRSGEQIHFQSNGVLSFFWGFTLCASSQHTVPRGARHDLHGSTASLFPPSLPPSLSLSLSVPRNLILSRNGGLNGINEPLWQRFQPMALPQPTGWEWMGSGEGRAKGHAWGW